MATLPPTSLFVRLDSRLRQGLQQQIYDEHPARDSRRRRRPGRAAAIVSRAGRRTSACRAPRRCWRSSSCRPKAISPRRRGSGTSVAARAARRSPAAARRRAAIERRDIRRSPAAARRWRLCPTAAERLGGPPRAFRLGTPAVDLFPIELVVAARESPPAIGDRRAARLRRPGGLRRAARGHRRPRAAPRGARAATPIRC